MVKQQNRDARFAASMDKRSRLTRQYNYAFVGDFMQESNATEANLNYGSYVNTNSYTGLNRNGDSYYSASFKQLDDAVKNLPHESQTITLLSNRDKDDGEKEGKSAINDIASISSIQASSIRQFAQKLIAKKVLQR